MDTEDKVNDFLDRMTDEFIDGLLGSMIRVGTGEKGDRFLVGLGPAIEYLTELAQNEDSDSFVEGVASMCVHLVWVDTPNMVMACWVYLLQTTMADNGIDHDYITDLMGEGNKRLETMLSLHPTIVRGGGFRLEDGRVLEGEELLGLAGVQFISDVSHMTCEQNSIDLGDDYEAPIN